MASQLIQVGFDPASVLEAFGLPSIEHTGLPSVQIQTGQAPDVNTIKDGYGVED